MTLREIREAYDKNYEEMLQVILEMGGEKYIEYHKKIQSPLYKKLQYLQRIEHRLSQLEESVGNPT